MSTTPKDPIILQGNVTDLTDSGDGFLRAEGYAVFVPGALPGDTISYTLDSRGTHFGRGTLLTIDVPSKDRMKPSCPYFGLCGGCQMQNLNYPAQLEIKQKHVEAALRRIGGITAPVSPIIGDPEGQFRYRNKITLPLRKNGAGMYAMHSHRFIPIDDCLLAPKSLAGILKEIKQLLARSPSNHFPNQLTVRWNQDQSQIMLILHGSSAFLPQETQWIEALSSLSNVISLYYYQNTEKDIPSDENYLPQRGKLRLLSGAPFLNDSIGHCKVRVSPLSFYQVNPTQRIRLYEQIRSYASMQRADSLLDICCGAGTIGLYIANQDSSIYGVEIIPQAIEDAYANATLNKHRSVSYLCNRAEIQIPLWIQNGLSTDLAILDPPRQGCDEKLLQSLSSLSYIIYVSCNPATLARDLRYLAKNGFLPISIKPFDLFPQTMHVECVTLIAKK